MTMTKNMYARTKVCTNCHSVYKCRDNEYYNINFTRKGDKMVRSISRS